MNRPLEILTRLNTETKICNAHPVPILLLAEEITGLKCSPLNQNRRRKQIVTAVIILRKLGWRVNGHSGYWLDADDLALFKRACANSEVWDILEKLDKCPSPKELGILLKYAQELERQKAVDKLPCYEN